MRIVLDTNVFISGIFFSGPTYQILRAWRDKKIQIVLSKEMLAEYQRVGEELSRKYSEIDIFPIIDLLTIYGEIVEPKDLSVSICEDPDDNKFIDCAISSNCILIVSGDKHLLKISGFQEIEILKPREFIDLHLK
jgi:putative PIN family toxin of toxin-antitoxin system